MIFEIIEKINIFKIYFKYLRINTCIFKKKFIYNFKLRTKLNSYSVTDDFLFNIFNISIFNILIFFQIFMIINEIFKLKVIKR